MAAKNRNGIDWSDDALDSLAEIRPEDIEAAKQWAVSNDQDELQRFIDAEEVDPLEEKDG